MNITKLKKVTSQQCQVISLPPSPSPKGGTKDGREIGRSAVKSEFQACRDFILQYQAGMIFQRELYRFLREELGREVFEGTRKSHENMKARCKDGYAALALEFETFDSFLFRMGPRPGADFSIDRIANAQGYSPVNCRWADKKTQARNRSITVLLTVDGVTRSLMEWAEHVGADPTDLYRRRRQKLSDKEVVYGKLKVLLPTSPFWPPKSWDDLDACVKDCPRWPNDSRVILRELLERRIGIIDAHCEFFSCPNDPNIRFTEKERDVERKWCEIYERYRNLLRTVVRLGLNRYE